jgi:hypothetical protein
MTGPSVEKTNGAGGVGISAAGGAEGLLVRYWTRRVDERWWRWELGNPVRKRRSLCTEYMGIFCIQDATVPGLLFSLLAVDW